MVYAGRGGFGNYTRSPKIAARETPESPELQALNRVPTSPAPIQHFTSPNQTFRAGRGGFGNNIPVTRMYTMTPAEYLKEVNDAVNVEPSIYAVGRGGRGNMVSRKTSLPNLINHTQFVLFGLFVQTSRTTVKTVFGLNSRQLFQINSTPFSNRLIYL